MYRNPTQALSLAALLAIASPIAQAGVFVVDKAGGGDFTTVQAAVDAARDGDVLLIRGQPGGLGGAYLEDVLIDNKELSLLKDTESGSDNVSIGRLTIRNLDAARTVVLRDVGTGFFTADTQYQGAGLVLSDNSGAVRVERGRIQGSHGDGTTPQADHAGGPGLLAEHCASVALTRCEYVIGGAGSGQVDGSTPEYGPGTGGPAVLAHDSSVTILNCFFLQGGRGGLVSAAGAAQAGTGGPCVLNDGSRVFVAGGIGGGGNGGDGGTVGGLGGDGLVQLSVAATTYLRDVSLSPGAGGSGSTQAGPPGQAQTIVAGSITQYPQDMAAASVAISPVHEKQADFVLIYGQPNDMVFLLAGLNAGDGLIEDLSGVRLVQAPVLYPAGVIEPSGLPVFANFRGPVLPPGVDAMNLFVQAVVIHEGDASLGDISIVTVLPAGT